MAPTVSTFPISGGTNLFTTWYTLISELSKNYIVSGLTPSDGGGLVVNIANGIAYCGGVRHSLTGGGFPLTMTDNTTNYIFYDPTTLDFHVDTSNSRPTNGVKIAEIITLTADITTLTDLREMQFGIPSGLIAIWSGSIVSIPLGWVLCNGSNDTPDLRDRFIIGAGSTYAVDVTGGETTHILTISELPAHTHTYGHFTSGSTWDYHDEFANNPSTTGSTGGGAAHENRPPYYALAFIMKL